MGSVHREKGKTMAIKESLLLYFRDINYAYNDSTRLDALEKGLAKLEEVVRCKDCKHYWRNHADDISVPVCLASPKEDAFCSEGRHKDDSN